MSLKEVDYSFALEELKKDGLLSLPKGFSFEARESDEQFFQWDSGKLLIQYKKRSYVLFALFSFLNGVHASPAYDYDDLGAMVDCSRNAVLTVDSVKKLIRLLSLLGYSSLQLYTEDTYSLDDEPYFGYMRGRYSKNEIKEIDQYANQFGIELVPCIETLAHLERIFPRGNYDAIRDNGGILLVGEEKTYQLIEKMVAAVSECFSSKKINIGMDEAFGLGCGNYLAKNGFEASDSIMLKHLDRVLEITKRHRLQPSMWGDMFFRLAYGEYFALGKEPVKKIQAPDGVKLIYWDYYHESQSEYDEMFVKSRLFSPNVAFAGGAWTWNGFVPFNRWSMHVSEAAIDSCKAHGIKDIFITMWGDNGAECSPFLALPSLQFVSAKIYGLNAQESDIIVKALSGISSADFLLLDKLNDAYPKKSTGVDNPSKYLLYNDLLCGLFDSVLPPQGEQYYAMLSEEIGHLRTNAFYAPLFKSLSLLSEAIAEKVALGDRIRKDYKAKDLVSLETDISSIDKAIEALSDFYRAYRKSYLLLNKPFGFDVADLRLGGLLERLRDAKETVQEYLSGDCKTIPQLEENVLPPFGNSSNDEATSFSFNDFVDTITVNSY